jgi:hypothetical protein
MTIFLLLLGGLAVWGIVASILVVSRDGYRRLPVRPPTETWRDAPDLTDVRPSDLAASQWLHDPAPAPRVARATHPAHAAGGMLLRPW